MGRVFNSRTLTAKELMPLPKPVLLCISRIDYYEAINTEGYQTVSLNLPLARSLTELSDSDIQSVIADKIRESLPQEKPVYLTDFEMLFNPRYELDVLRLFIDLSRRNKLIVKWCGRLDGDSLVYAEPGFEDYKRIKISNYDVTIVK